MLLILFRFSFVVVFLFLLIFLFFYFIFVFCFIGGNDWNGPWIDGREFIIIAYHRATACYHDQQVVVQPQPYNNTNGCTNVIVAQLSKLYPRWWIVYIFKKNYMIAANTENKAFPHTDCPLVIKYGIAINLAYASVVLNYASCKINTASGVLSYCLMSNVKSILLNNSVLVILGYLLNHRIIRSRKHESSY